MTRLDHQTPAAPGFGSFMPARWNANRLAAAATKSPVRTAPSVARRSVVSRRHRAGRSIEHPRLLRGVFYGVLFALPFWFLVALLLL